MIKRIFILAASLLAALAGIICLDVAIFTSEDQFKAQIINRLSSQIDARVEIGSASYKLFSDIHIEKLAIYAARKDNASAGGGPILSVRQARIRPNLPAVIGLGGDLVGRAVLDDVDLSVTRMAGGELDVARMIKVEAEKAGPVRLPRTVINGFRGRFRDLAAADGREHETVLPELNLSFDPTALSLEDETLRVSLHNERLGQVDVIAGLDREGRRFMIQTTGKADRIILGPSLYELLPREARDVWDIYDPAGAIRISEFNLRIDSTPKASRPVELEAVLTLDNCRMNFAMYPLPIDHVSGTMKIKPRRIVVNLAGRCGAVKLAADGEIAGDLFDTPAVRLDLSATGVRFDQVLAAALTKPRLDKVKSPTQRERLLQGADGRRVLLDRYAPQGGPFAFTVQIRRPEGDAALPDASVAIDLAGGVSACYQKFPYRFYNLAGRIEVTGDNVGIASIRGEAKDGVGRAVMSRGLVSGSGPTERVDVDIVLENFAIDGDLRAALRPEVQRTTWDRLRPQGRCNGTVKIFRDPAVHNEIQIDVQVELDGRASIQYAAFPARLEQIEGRLKITNSSIEFDKGELAATWRQSKITGRGRITGLGSDGVGGQETATIDLEVKDLRLDDEFRGLLGDKAGAIWDRLGPSGVVQVQRARITKPAGSDEPRVSLTVSADGDLSLCWAPLPLPVDRVKGTVVIGPDGEVSFDRLSGTPRVEGARSLEPAEGSDAASVVLTNGHFGGGPKSGGARPDPAEGAFGLDVSISGLPVNEAVRKAMPPQVRWALDEIHFAGRVAQAKVRLDNRLPNAPAGTSLWGEIRLSGVAVGADGEIGDFSGLLQIGPDSRYDEGGGGLVVAGMLRDASFVLFKKWRVENLNCRAFRLDGGILQVSAISADVAGGKIPDGYVSIEFNKAVDFKGAVSLKGALLGRLGQDKEGNGGKVAGTVDGWINVKGQASDTASITGDGSIQITRARIWEVPILFSVLNVLALRIPKQEYIGEAVAKFKIGDERFIFKDVRLDSPSMHLAGTGHIDFHEELQFDMQIKLLTFLSGVPYFSDAVGIFTNNLIRVIVTGTFEKPEAYLTWPFGIG